MEAKTHIAIAIIFSIFGFLVLGTDMKLRTLDALLWIGIFSMVPNIDRRVLKLRGRSFTHSLVFALMVFAILYIPSMLIGGNGGYAYNFIGLEGALFASLGIVSHIFADSLTSSGVPVLYPIYGRKHFHFPYIGPRLRLEDNFKSDRIQIAAVIVVILLLIVDILDYFVI
ncbi:MAG: metal-dependent hydrolase [Candidatus Methanofastidiosa archaeon]|nr:metal-dependent hydrolase [Candidatus Methanofastidiosa archaeon]